MENNPVLFVLAMLSISFLIIQCLFFLVMAYRNGLRAGVEKSQLNGTVVSGVLFSFIPSVALLVTAVMIMQSLGFSFALTRMNFVASLQDNIMIFESVFSAFDLKLSSRICNISAYVTIVWGCVISVCMALIVFPIALLLMNKPKRAKEKNKSSFVIPESLGHLVYSGIAAVFTAVAIAGKGEENVLADGAGVLSVFTLLTSFICMAVLRKLSEAYSIKWLKNYSVSLSMLFSIALSVIFVLFMPLSIAEYEWRS